MTSDRTRRSFLGNAFSVAATAALAQAQMFIGAKGWFANAQTATSDLVHDTFNGLLAFVVPGSDSYSVAQGVSTAGPGGVVGGATDVLIKTVDESTPFIPSFSSQVAAILNGLALAVNPAPAGSFISTFSRLSFAEKAGVFAIMDATDSLTLLGGIIPPFVAFFCYSDAGTFDPASRSLTGEPPGWQLSSYQGVADGRDEFLGYFPGTRNMR
jgi:hypothetical protein